MKVSEIADKLGLTIYTSADEAEKKEVSGCYIGDLLSLAMSRIEQGFAWITIQTNINIVAVASLAEAACIIVADGFTPDENTIKKASEENIVILGGEISAYQVATGLAKLGI